MKIRFLKDLGLSAGIAAPMLGLSSCSSSSEPDVLSMLVAAPVILPIAGIYAGLEAEERMKKRERERAEALKAKRKDGPFVELWPNGKKRAEGTYKNTELHGLHTKWRKSGQKSDEGHYDEGRLIKSTSWHENGQKSGETGETSAAWWYENGQLERQYFYHDASRRLKKKETWWYENGQKSYEVNYERGGVGVPSIRYWNKNGEEVPHKEWDSMQR